MKRLFFPLIGLILAVAGAGAQTPRAIEAQIKNRLATLEKWSSYGMNSDVDKLEHENRLLKQDLLKYGRQAATLAYGFPRLKGDMHVVTSPDGRLRIYSWDCQTGGTMHDFDAVIQYRGASGKVHTWTPAMESGSAGGFYHDLFQIQSARGPIYLAVSTFIASGSLIGESIHAMTIDGEKLVSEAKRFRTSSGLQSSIEFGYDFSSVMDRPERPIKLFKFDTARKTLSFPVVIEDEETPQGRVTDKLITYRFDGTNFVKER